MIRKAVITAAGFGTRFLPATKAQPKEMLPIIDTPTIQFVAEEAVHSGIRDLLMVTGRGKQSIEAHFDRTFELESFLATTGKLAQLDVVRRLSSLARFHFVRQRDPRGLGDAVNAARDHVGGQPFVVLLGDTICVGDVPCTRQLIDVYNQVQSGVIAVEEVPDERVRRHGIVIGERVDEDLFRIDDLMEKPDPSETASRLAVCGRYICTPDIFTAIDETRPDERGMVQITDALRRLTRDRPLYAVRFKGTRFGIGDRLDYLRATVRFALRRSDIGADFRQFLQQCLEEDLESPRQA